VTEIAEPSRQQRLANIQSAVSTWSHYNFRDRMPYGKNSALGLVEEVGELAHAVLKSRQKIRGTAIEHLHAQRDAIGDVLIYLCDTAADVGIDLKDFQTDHRESTDETCLLGMLATSAGNVAWACDALGAYPENLPRSMTPYLNSMMQSVVWYCNHLGWDYLEILEETWARVKDRDWIKYPDTGRPPEKGDY
jgi:NTP pyrophosphatase (non-canonical NTP hydrolase)